MNCEDGPRHHFFVAEVLAVESEGMVYVLIVCTSCGESQAKAHKVAQSGSPLRLLLEDKKKKE